MQDKEKTDETDDFSVEIIDVDEEGEAAAATPVKAKSEMRKEAEEADFNETFDIAWSALESQVEQLKNENGSLKDQLLRKQAEFENYRKRTEREKTEARQNGRRAVLIDMLSVLDNFERALATAAKGAEDDPLRLGVELIYKQFKDTLTKLGVEPLDAVGKTFDPHLHEAVTIEETSAHEANTVIEEFQKGYLLGDQLLRPAQVKVAAAPGG